ncbi:MAG TPA: trimethylamine methyltransferase family protein [Bradyrhizobium sp.]|nr:trimethylamine methyltransferase family protein [Bradyrhizobium sp.]
MRATARVRRVRDGKLELSGKWLQLRNPYAPVQVLDEEQIERIHDASMTVLEDVGMRIQDADARNYFAAAGFSVDHPTERVHFDREGILELVAKAPSVASVRGRDPAKKLFMGEGQVAFTAVSGPPFVSDLDHGRRAGTFRDQENFLKMTHMTDVLQIEGGTSVEAQDLPADTRYLDFYLSCCKLSDKPWKPLTIGRHRARDAIDMAKIWYGEDEEGLAANPVFFVNTNTNTPLVLDGEIAQGVIEYAKLGQVVCVTPFGLAGAMAPATVAGALVMQNAETLACCALTQIVRPRCPYIYGGFICNADMRTGSPAFGTPEFTLGAQATGQMARRYGLPWRSGGALTSSQTCDAQAAYEAMMVMTPTFLAGTNYVMHAAGWLEAGLVACYEKFIVDIEILRMLQVQFTPLEINEESLAFGAHEEVGAGGHFLGAVHTLERFRECFYRPLLSSTENFDRWTRNGGQDAAERAGKIWRDTLEQYEEPPIDDAVKAELGEYVTRRRAELGD